MASSSSPSRGQTIAGALWWVVTGSLMGLGVVSILTIGIFLLAAGGLMALIGVKFFSSEGVPIFALVGVAAIPLLMAYLYRHGPGEWCETDGSETSCVELPWGPWGFVAVAVVVLIAVPLIWRSIHRSHTAAR